MKIINTKVSKIQPLGAMSICTKFQSLLQQRYFHLDQSDGPADWQHQYHPYSPTATLTKKYDKNILIK